MTPLNQAKQATPHAIPELRTVGPWRSHTPTPSTTLAIEIATNIRLQRAIASMTFRFCLAISLASSGSISGALMWP